MRAAERQEDPQARAVVADGERLRALERENRELRQANEILRKAAVDSMTQCNSASNLAAGVS